MSNTVRRGGGVHFLGVGAIVALLAVPSTVIGADRCVLGEYYNGTW